MSEMVERVAKAIAAERAEPWDDMNDDERRSWSETARAAIEAMMEEDSAACIAAHDEMERQIAMIIDQAVIPAVVSAYFRSALVNRKE